VVSKFAKKGHVSHEYADHVSIIKFIERNWGLEPVTHRSRGNPYAPVNSPAH
jgi:phospholipase C